MKYSSLTLHSWKANSEAAAARNLKRRPRETSLDTAIEKAEKLMPELLSEMRQDLTAQPLQREFILLKKSWVYNSGGREILCYYYDEYPQLNNAVQILLNLGLVADITYNNTKRYVILEHFAEYLTS